MLGTVCIGATSEKARVQERSRLQFQGRKKQRPNFPPLAEKQAPGILYYSSSSFLFKAKHPCSTREARIKCDPTSPSRVASIHSQTAARSGGGFFNRGSRTARPKPPPFSPEPPLGLVWKKGGGRRRVKAREKTLFTLSSFPLFPVYRKGERPLKSEDLLYRTSYCSLKRRG